MPASYWQSSNHRLLEHSAADTPLQVRVKVDPLLSVEDRVEANALLGVDQSAIGAYVRCASDMANRPRDLDAVPQ